MTDTERKVAATNKVAIVHNIPIHYKHLLFSALAERGLDFTVLFMAARSKGAVAFDSRLAVGERYKYRLGFTGPYEKASATTRAAFVWKNLNSLSPALLIISGYYAIECWVALLWAKLHKAPVVMWFESNEFDAPRHWPKEALKRIFLKGCDQAHVYGTSNADYLRKLGMPESRLLRKRAVVNADLFRSDRETRTYRNAGVTRLLYVGRLAPEKNLELLLRAFTNVHARGPADSTRLVLVGTGPLEGRLKEKCTELGIEKCVEFLGHRPQADLPGVFRSCDVFVLPSVSETWGLVVNEALLCRMPVIVSRQCGCAVDLVTPETGWTFSPLNQSELEAAIFEAVALSSERLAAMGDAGIKLGLDYTPENCAGRVIEGLSRLKPACTTISGAPATAHQDSR
jgi:glycosyltransferase involved in cell wall biosynthesis